MKTSTVLILLALISTLPATPAVAGDLAAKESPSVHKGCSHAHSAPHNGTLIPVGDHVGHLELLLDEKSGTVRLFVLDAHAENPIRVTNPSLTLEIQAVAGNEVEPYVVELEAKASVLTGEKVGDSSEFIGTHSNLAGTKSLAGQIKGMTLRGVVFENVPVTFDVPDEKPNASAKEHSHEHGHEHDHAEHHHDH